MKLVDIILCNAEMVENSGVSVDINRSQSWVDMQADGETKVFLQGHEADSFIDAVDEMAEQLPDVDYGIIELSFCYDYLTIISEM